MIFPHPLVRGHLIRRYKRFLADIMLEDGSLVTAHIANSGAMTGVAEPGTEVWLSPAAKPGRKCAWSWELARIGGYLVGVNTAHPNAIAAEAIMQGRITELTGYQEIRREVCYGINSRIDLLLSSPERPRCYVEIKSVHLKRGDGALFPDAVTTRGAKHLTELRQMVRQGHRAMMVFLVQRADCAWFAPAADIDPVYAAALTGAVAAGVEVCCYDCNPTTAGIEAGRALPLILDGGEAILGQGAVPTERHLLVS